MQKVIRLLMFFTLLSAAFGFTLPQKQTITWISVKDLEAVYYSNPKPILIDVYTDWCGWCKEMDRTTYKNQKLVAYINANYYAVKLNAESPETIIFNRKSYDYNNRDKTNQLAAFLLFNQLEFPTTVFLPTIDAQPAPLPGYMKAKEMEAPLKYFAGGAHRTESFESFHKHMKKEW